MAYQIQHDYLVVTNDGNLIARARGSDPAGWTPMSTAARDGLNKRVGSGTFPTLRAALASRITPEFWPQLDAALKQKD